MMKLKGCICVDEGVDAVHLANGRVERGHAPLDGETLWYFGVIPDPSHLTYENQMFGIGFEIS